LAVGRIGDIPGWISGCRLAEQWPSGCRVLGGVVLVVAGLVALVHAIVQFARAGDTPAPVTPTARLVVNGLRVGCWDGQRGRPTLIIKLGGCALIAPSRVRAVVAGVVPGAAKQFVQPGFPGPVPR